MRAVISEQVKSDLGVHLNEDVPFDNKYVCDFKYGKIYPLGLAPFAIISRLARGDECILIKMFPDKDKAHEPQ